MYNGVKRKEVFKILDSPNSLEGFREKVKLDPINAFIWQENG